MNIINRKFIFALSICLLPTVSQASIIEFNFTGQLVIDTGAAPINQPISASLTYDTISGIGSSGLSIVVPGAIFGQPATFHDITMTHDTGSNTIIGNMLIDWNVTYDMPSHIEWDATGLFNAINYGLQAGDVISGTTLYHDNNNDGVYDLGDTILADVGSATPYSDSLQLLPVDEQGPAPMAATSNSLGITEGPFTGLKTYIDIGSGNSMHIVSVSAVPVPAAVWLFGSGLLGLIGVARRKTA